MGQKSVIISQILGGVIGQKSIIIFQILGGMIEAEICHYLIDFWVIGVYHISNHHNFFLTSVVIVVPYCCLFCVVSNDMLNVSNSIDMFS